jgi:hypothetical protein
VKITRKQLRKIIEASLDEIGLMQSIFGNTQDRWKPSFDSDKTRYDRGQAAMYSDVGLGDGGDGGGDEGEEEEEDPDDLLQENDYASHREKAVDIDWTFDDGSHFTGDLEDIGPEEAFSVGYKMAVSQPEIGIDGGLDNNYPDKTLSQKGRMFDYGSSKSDSHEGRMTRAKLFRMAQMSQSLEAQLQDGDDLPGWVQDKVTTAEDRLRSAYDYMDYKIRRMKQSGEKLTESKIRREIRKYLLNT